jgi:hypothetical protein
VEGRGDVLILDLILKFAYRELGNHENPQVRILGAPSQIPTKHLSSTSQMNLVRSILILSSHLWPGFSIIASLSFPTKLFYHAYYMLHTANLLE